MHEATIINKDCVAGMKELPNDYVDLTVTSPPYDEMREYDGHATAFDFKATAQQLYGITKPGGVVVWVVADQTKDGDESGASFRQALFFRECGFRLFDTMIYAKPCRGCIGSSVKGYWQAFEYMFVLSKDGYPKTTNILRDRKNVGVIGTDGTEKLYRNPDGTQGVKVWQGQSEYGRRTNIWYYGTGNGLSCKDKIAHEHPAIFPEALARDHIRSWSNPGDLVFDPFAGSATTLVMAVDENRRALGFEINPDYCEIGRTRLARHVVQESLDFEGGA